MTTKLIPARDLRETDVLDFHAEIVGADGSLNIVHGMPITKVTHRGGRITVDVVYIDGTRRYRTFASGDQVQILVD